MLKPIPDRILQHAVTFQVCTGVDVWQKPTTESVEVRRVCMQPSTETRFVSRYGVHNTEVTFRAVLFIDAQLSLPKGIEPAALKEQSEANGAPLRCDFNGISYTVHTVDTLYDDTSVIHHWEVGLV